MARPTSIASSTAKEYCEKFSKTGNAPLARKLYKEFPELFKDVEAVRTLVRYHRGQLGEKNVKKIKDKSLFKSSNNYYELPDEYNDVIKPFIIPKAYKRVGVLSDIHIPYHSNLALTASLNFLKKKKVDCIILNGDTLDCYQLSKFEKDPRKRSFKEELDAVRQFLHSLKKNFPKTKIYLKLGNHEIRFMKYLMIKAPELLDIEEFRLDVLLRFGELGIGLIYDKQIIKLGKLNILHGHEIAGGAGGVNPARSIFLKTNESVLIGHFHKTSSHTETSLLDKTTTTHSTGCLCYLKADYMPYNKWNNGFAYIEVENNGNYYLQNLRIIDGEVY